MKSVDKNGDELEQLLKKSDLEGETLLLTLKNDKVYIGFCEETPIPKKTNYLSITPILSGYRKKETKELVITTDYLKVVEKFIKDTELSEGKEVEEITLETDIIIKQDEILTASIYKQDVYDAFNNEADTTHNTVYKT